MPISEEYQQAILNGCLDSLLEAAGGSFVMALLLNGTELSGNGYVRKTISSFNDASVVGGNGLSTVRMVPDTPLTATGGNITWNQMRILDSTGTNLVFPTFSTTGTILQGESKKVTAVFGLPDNDNLISRVTTLESGLAVTNASLAELDSLFSERQKIDFRDFGTVNDDDVNNTAAFWLAAAERDEDGKPYHIYACPGIWNFAGSMGVNDLDDLTIANILSVQGVYRARSAQLEEEGGFTDDKNYTVFQIDMDDETFWWDQIREGVIYGPIAWSDISFRFINRGQGFSYGDYVTSNPATVTMRGLLYERCYISRFKHFAGADTGDGRPAIINDVTNGKLINRNTQAVALRCSRIYDSRIEIDTRGFFRGLDAKHCDRMTGDIRSLLTGQTIVESKFEGETDDVASTYSTIWSENHLISGGVIKGHVGHLRTEINATNFSVPPQRLTDIPDDVTWTIAAEADEVVFTFPRAINCLDYFWDHYDYTFTPTQDVPPVELYILEVTATTLRFAYADDKSYIRFALSGVGSGIKREIGIGAIALGDKVDISSRSQGGSIANVCPLVCHPDSKMQIIAANTNGRTSFPSDPNLFRVANTNVGSQDTIMGGVSVLGGGDVLNHPLVNKEFLFDRRIRHAKRNDWTKQLKFLPGEGVSSINDCAQQLIIRTRAETSGELVPVYRPSDSAVGWEMRDLKLVAGQDTDVTLRVYRFASPATVSLWAGAVGSIPTVLSTSGWQEITVPVPAANFVADGNGAYLQLGGTNYEVAWAITTPT